MSDLIYRSHALNAINMSLTINSAWMSVAELPSAQPDRKTGKWIDCEEDWIVWCRCSECNYPVSAHYNYCPRCGAIMDGEVNEMQ